MIYCAGCAPILVIMNEEGEEIDEIELAMYTEESIQKLLESKGFNKFQ